jgi:hypothetical protein
MPHETRVGTPILNGDDEAGGTIDADAYSKEIKPSNGVICLVYRFNQAGTGNANLVATLRLQVWNGPLIGWAEDTLGVFPTHPAGALTDPLTVTFVNMWGAKYRVMVDRTSGDGLGIIESMHGRT